MLSIGCMTSSLAVKQFLRRGGLAVVVLVILAVYGFEAHARRQLVSSPARSGDQAAYLAYAQQMYDSGYAVVGDRNRMPVFPFLLSLIYHPSLSETEFLERAQTFNVNLSILLLLLLFLIFRKFFPAFYAVALLVVTAFGVFLYRAVLAQTEVLFYFISFCGFLLLVRMLIAPRWWLAVLSGAAVGLAHLTKASVLPGLGVWVAVFLAQFFWNYRARRDTRPGNPWHRLALLLLVIGTFVAVISPYIRTSKQIYGHYFYNVNSTFTMWCDSWPEARAFLNTYGDKGKWRDLPPDQIPSPTKYWREHSVSQITHRLMSGLRGIAAQNAMAIAYYKFMFLFAATAAFLWMRHPQQAHRLIAEKPFAAAFCVLFVAVYVILYAWYNAIVSDTRFILSIFLPFVFTASIFILALGRDRTVAIAGRRLRFTQLFAWLLISLALIDVVYNAFRAYQVVA
jgi:hypothetical protein